DVTMATRCAPRFYYGKTLPETHHDETTGSIVFREGGNRLKLATTGQEITFAIIDATASATIRLTQGQRCALVLSFADTNESLPHPPDAYQALQQCSNWWVKWTARNEYQFRWGDAVKRS